jgi:hypothetical protein
MRSKIVVREMKLEVVAGDEVTWEKSKTILRQFKIITK